MCTESGSELCLVDALRFLMGLNVSIPPVGCRTRKLLTGKQHLLTVVALHHLQLLLNRLEPIISIHRLHSIRKDWRLSALKISQPIPRWWWCLGLCMQVDHGLLHGLKHLRLHSQHMLKSEWRGWLWVGILVVVLLVVFSIVGSNMVPCVGHLKYEY
jgi:hypothetical protein